MIDVNLKLTTSEFNSLLAALRRSSYDPAIKAVLHQIREGKMPRLPNNRVVEP